ncbi:MAG: alpha-glucan family phosphorylase [Chloroflexota bacterium]
MMKVVGKLHVFPKLPEPIARLQELAYNLWWSWESRAQDLYRVIDEDLWEMVNHNPVKFLRNVDQAKLVKIAADSDYLNRYRVVCNAFDAYMDSTADTWFSRNHPDKMDQIVAYFSAEFGLHEALPIYSGGLGILSGDHCKAASDLGLPFMGIGFLYPQGYFTQHIDEHGQQHATYEHISFSEVPAQLMRDANGEPLQVHVDLPGRAVYVQIWHIQVGRIPIFLMDTDVEHNAPQDRELSARLYGGDHEMRISQEIILGIGGVRAVRALGHEPAVWHMNEGHSAFMGLERVRELVQKEGVRFDEAVEAVRANTVFTTHTPVPAGNDAFGFELVEKFFWQYWGQLHIDRDGFINFARQELDWGHLYSMTVLALRLSAYHNGVSKLHGSVSRGMWSFLWPGTPTEQVPISHVTNGVHVKTWLAPELRTLYGQYLSDNEAWLEEVDAGSTWDAVDSIPDAALWEAHLTRKDKMIAFVRNRVRQQLIRHGEGPHSVRSADTLLNPKALTIGFARRFATYKRATLIFRDEERLKRLVNDPERPIQIVFSGKAHPQDEPGKALIRHVYELSQHSDFHGKIVFVENYDMNIARHLISGVDIWLNNPRRPHEASGTSGQKAALSGVPNFSVLDGWWVEGYIGEDGEYPNGWQIGQERAYKDEHTQDEADALDLYATLEEAILPLYFDRDDNNLPHGWIERMKNSIRTCAPQFSMKRMLKDYTTQLYLPAAVSGQQYLGDNLAVARAMATWKGQMHYQWHGVHVEAHLPSESQVVIGESIEVGAKVWLSGINQAHVTVELLAQIENASQQTSDLLVIPMHFTHMHDGAFFYRASFMPEQGGKLSLGIRTRPAHESLIQPYEIGLSAWA